MNTARRIYEQGKPWPLFFLCTFGPLVAIGLPLTLIYGTDQGCP